MHDFQHGDSVRIIYRGSKDFGKTGTVMNYPDNNGPIKVLHDDESGTSGWSYRTSLEFIESEETAAINLLGEEYFQ